MEGIKDRVTEWYKMKEQASFFEKKADKLRNEILEYMNEIKIDSILTTDYIVKKKEMTRESVTKKDLPEDIWKKYCKQLNYETLTIKEHLTFHVILFIFLIQNSI